MLPARSSSGRPTLLMPGMVNARTRIGRSAAAELPILPEDGLLCIANLLKAGITCFCHIGYYPRQAAQTAAARACAHSSDCRWPSIRVPGREAPAII